MKRSIRISPKLRQQQRRALLLRRSHLLNVAERNVRLLRERADLAAIELHRLAPPDLICP